MMEEQMLDKNLFMMCRKLENDAVTELPNVFDVRYCRKSELDTWKAIHFNTPELATKYYNFISVFAKKRFILSKMYFCL